MKVRGGKVDELSEERKERLSRRYLAFIKDFQKDKPDPEKLEESARKVADILYRTDLGDVREFNTKEDALNRARQIVGVPPKEPTEEELKQKDREAGEKFAREHITGVLLSSSIKKGTKEELNLARICKLVGADPKTTDLGVDKAKTKKVIRNYKKMDAETLGLVDQAKKRILINWSVPVDLKDKNGSDLKLPLAGMNLVTAVRALGWVSWNTEGSQLQKATERYRKITDRLRLTRKDKKCHKKT